MKRMTLETEGEQRPQQTNWRRTFELKKVLLSLGSFPFSHACSCWNRQPVSSPLVVFLFPCSFFLPQQQDQHYSRCCSWLSKMYTQEEDEEDDSCCVTDTTTVSADEAGQT